MFTQLRTRSKSRFHANPELGQTLRFRAPLWRSVRALRSSVVCCRCSICGASKRKVMQFLARLDAFARAYRPRQARDLNFGGVLRACVWARAVVSFAHTAPKIVAIVTYARENRLCLLENRRKTATGKMRRVKLRQPPSTGVTARQSHGKFRRVGDVRW